MGKSQRDELYDLIETKLYTAEQRNAIRYVGHGLAEFWLANSTTSCLISYDSRKADRQFVIRPAGGGAAVATISRQQALSSSNDLTDVVVKQLCGMIRPLETFFGDQEPFALLDRRKAVMIIDRQAFDHAEPIVHLIEGTKLNGLDHRDVAKRLAAFWKLRARQVVIKTPLPHGKMIHGGDGRISWLQFEQNCGVGYLRTGERYVKYSLLTRQPVPERRTFLDG